MSAVYKFLNKISSGQITKVEAAEFLGITRPTLDTRIRKKNFKKSEIALIKSREWVKIANGCNMPNNKEWVRVYFNTGYMAFAEYDKERGFLDAFFKPLNHITHWMSAPVEPYPPID